MTKRFRTLLCKQQLHETETAVFFFNVGQKGSNIIKITVQKLLLT